MADRSSGNGGGEPRGQADDDLARRRRDLDAAIAARRSEKVDEVAGADRGGKANWGHALRLSSEFISAIVVGAALGWFIDRGLGSSPWGLIGFLLLGFAAGVLNVMRATGQVAEFGRRTDRTED
ncbi:MAG: AtpZ/AtpI family protein [Rhizobiaceae bacterium]|nr:AtpZ/AtpI family protein [Rhizobiaceae bacterium]MCV0406178.1 AtpZ/AtpI family protein [Rhizobiaceae bacterium]